MTTYPLPQLSVEIAWESPDSGSVSWLDVSDRVRATGSAVTMTRGRSDERSDGNQPGTLSLVLDNQDGYFTPGSSGSPYYPDIVPWRRIRVQIATSATVDLFYGFVKSWTQGWDSRDVATVTVQAVDSLALLGRRSLRSVLSETVRADEPFAYWPLSEPDGATRALDVIGGRTLVLEPPTSDGLTFGSGTGPPCDESAALQFGAFDTAVLRSTAAPYSDGLPSFTIEAFTLGSNVVFLLAHDAGAAGSSFGVFGGAPFGSLFSGGISVSGAAISAGRTHHIALTHDAFAPSTVLYVDGVAVDTDPSASFGLPGVVGLTIVGGDSTLSNVAMYDEVLTAGQIQAHYEAGMTGFAGESTWERIERWCGWVGVDVTNEGAGDGEALGHIPTAGRTVLDCVADALRTDYGSLLLAALDDRAVRFYDRTTRYEAVAAVTLDCADDQVDGDLQVLMDPTYVASRVTATTPTGVFESRNAATEAVYGDLGMDVSVFPDDDGFAVSLAEGLGQVAASPVPRIPTVTTDLLVMALDSAAYDPTAIPEVGAAVSLTNLPPTAPDSSLDAFVEGLTETISGSAWRRTASLSPAYPWLSTWLVEDPNGRGVIEAGNVIAL